MLQNKDSTTSKDVKVIVSTGVSVQLKHTSKHTELQTFLWLDSLLGQQKIMLNKGGSYRHTDVMHIQTNWWQDSIHWDSFPYISLLFVRIIFNVNISLDHILGNPHNMLHHNNKYLLRTRIVLL